MGFLGWAFQYDKQEDSVGNALPASHRGEWASIAVFILLTIGVVVRLRQYLFNASYFYDECFHLLILPGRSFAEFFQPLPYCAVAPPGYFQLLRFLELVGGIANELIMRLPSFLAGLAALLIMTPLSRRTLPGQAGPLWAIACTALSARALFHGCEVHPYTIDLLFAVCIIVTTVSLLSPSATRRTQRRNWFLLFALAVATPCFSFPCAFYLAGVSAVLGWQAWRAGSRRQRVCWFVFNALVGVSSLAVWFFFARKMYYPEMNDFWGPKGLGGFPDLSHLGETLWWIATRPFAIAHYANQDVGYALTPLALWGSVVLYRLDKRYLILLLAPFLLALAAGLAGKYPVADRTLMFLAPSLWLLSGAAVADLAGRGVFGRWLIGIAAANLALNLFKLGLLFVVPSPQLDYRGAYEFVHAQMCTDDLVWDQMGVVYQTYHGMNRNVISDEEQALAEASRRRLWTVGAPDLDPLHRSIEAAGGQCVLRKVITRIEIRLYEPLVISH